MVGPYGYLLQIYKIATILLGQVMENNPSSNKNRYGVEAATYNNSIVVYSNYLKTWINLLD